MIRVLQLVMVVLEMTIVITFAGALTISTGNGGDDTITASGQINVSRSN